MARAATSRLKVNPILGIRPIVENCRIPDLGIDPAYQRSIENGSSKSLIRKIAMYWDWSLFHPLTVSRRADGSLWVIDGQHRLAAARLRGDLYDLPCILLSCGSLADEAANFVALNQQRRALNAIDLFRAALAAGDADARAIDRLIASAGLELAPHTNHTAWSPGMLSNIGGIRECYRRFGPEITRRALEALCEAFAGQVLRYGGTIFGAIAYYLGEIDPSDFDFELFVMVLSGASQREWVSEIEAMKGREGIRRQIAGKLVLAQAMREAMGCDIEREPV